MRMATADFLELAGGFTWEWIPALLVLAGALYLGVIPRLLRPAPAPAGPAAASPAVLSHEIKNYVCTVKGNAYLLRQRLRDGDETAMLERIERAAEKLEAFTREWSTAQDG